MPEANPLNSPREPARPLDELLAELPATWAGVSAESSGLEMAAAQIRLAYGLGYTTGLTDAQDA